MERESMSPVWAAQESNCMAYYMVCEMKYVASGRCSSDGGVSSPPNQLSVLQEQKKFDPAPVVMCIAPSDFGSSWLR